MPDTLTHQPATFSEAFIVLAFSRRIAYLCTFDNSYHRRGCAAFMGRDINKLKGKGSGKFKYMAEKDMLELAENFRPYRYVCRYISC